MCAPVWRFCLQTIGLSGALEDAASRLHIRRVHPEFLCATTGAMGMKRFGIVIRLEPGQIESYKKYHRDVWPEILETIRRCHIRNYSIYLKDDYLFGYYEYHGADHAADMARMADDPK